MSMQKTVRIPRYLHDIHGTDATVSSLILTYLAGIILGIIGAMSMAHEGLEPWKLLLVGILFFDIGGGVVANLTSSTNRYYQQSEQRRIFYLLIHIAQPLLLAALLGEYWWHALGLAVYTIGSAFIVNMLRTTENQQAAAGIFVVLGIGGLSLINLEVPGLYAFAALYIVKLLVGFAVKRPDLRHR